MIPQMKHFLGRGAVQDPSVSHREKIVETIEEAKRRREAADLYVSWLERALTPPERLNKSEPEYTL